MIKHSLLAALAVVLVACNSSGSSSESAQEIIGSPSVNSFAQTPRSTATTSLALNLGTKGQPNQFVIADVLTYGGPKLVITPPADWTLIRDDSTPTTRQSLYWHTIQSNESSPPTWTFSDPVDAQGAALLLNNVETASPIDIASGNTGTGGTLTAKSVATTSDGDLVLSFYATDFHLPGLAPQTPAITAPLINQEATSHEFWILESYQRANGLTEERVCSAAQLFNWVAVQVAIKKGAATPSAS